MINFIIFAFNFVCFLVKKVLRLCLILEQVEKIT